MISGLISLIIKLISYVMIGVINIIMTLFPNLGIVRIADGLSAFWVMMAGAVNMTNFLVGPGFYIYLDIALIIWGVKHTILPVVIFMRKILIKN